MKKFFVILLISAILMNLVGCGENISTEELEDSKSTYTESSNVEQSKKVSDDKTYNNDEIEYFSVLELTNNTGLRFNMTLNEFIENYNQLVIDYANTYSNVNKNFIVGADFKKQNNSQQNSNGVLCDLYICFSTLFGYNENLGICVEIEQNSHNISGVSVAIDNNVLMKLTYEQRVLYTIQRHIVYRALINELTLNDCYNIDEKIQVNSENGFVPAHFERGIAFCLDSSYVQSIGIQYFRIQPCTKEQWKSAPGFKDIPID